MTKTPSIIVLESENLTLFHHEKRGYSLYSKLLGQNLTRGAKTKEDCLIEAIEDVNRLAHRYLQNWHQQERTIDKIKDFLEED